LVKSSAVTVTANPGPTLSVQVLPSPIAGYVGTGFTISTIWSPVEAGPYDYDIDYGDGSAHAIGTTSPYQPAVTFVHAYSAVGDFTIKATIKNTSTGVTGSGQATVSVAKIPSALSCGATPATGVVPLSVTVSGKLTRTDTGGGLGGKSLNIYVDGVKVAAASTVSDGSYSTKVTITTAGTRSIYADFAGDATTLGCSEETGPSGPAGWGYEADREWSAQGP